VVDYTIDTNQTVAAGLGQCEIDVDEDGAFAARHLAQDVVEGSRGTLWKPIEVARLPEMRPGGVHPSERLLATGHLELESGVLVVEREGPVPRRQRRFAVVCCNGRSSGTHCCSPRHLVVRTQPRPVHRYGRLPIREVLRERQQHRVGPDGVHGAYHLHETLAVNRGADVPIGWRGVYTGAVWRHDGERLARTVNLARVELACRGE